MKQAISCLCLLIAALGLLPGCDEVQSDDFGGVMGIVGQPAIGGCAIDVYDALEFESLESITGRVGVGTSRANGRFAIELPDAYLGRPLILVARPGPTALYRDFGAVGAPDVVWDDPRQPWVAVLNEWRGGEIYVAINPITTMAFHSLMRLPTEEFGPGKQRFDREVVNAVHAATAANFGVRVDPSSEGVTPPSGSEFEPLDVFYLEDSDRCQAYAYVCLQLAIAANDFSNTTAAADNALDFYEALFHDAQDGALDGQYFGTPEPVLNQVPALVGREPTGESSLLLWLSTHALTPLQQGFLSNARAGGGFDPAPADILDVQSTATGALRPTRIDSFDVQNYPYSGNLVMTIKGAGLRNTDRFVFRSADDAGAEFFVDRDSVGVDGEYQFHSDTELQLRIPDFAVTTRTVHPALQVASGADFRIVRLIIENQPEIKSTARDVEHQLVADARVTDRTEPLLVSVQIGRVDALGELHEAEYGNNLGSADPASLTPGVDDVYELRVRVTNPGPAAVNNLGLDLGLSAYSQLGNPVVADVFGGAAANRALIFESALPTANLNTGDVAELSYRFMFLDTAIPADLLLGAPVKFTPVLSSGPATPTTSDVVGFNRTVQLGPAVPDQTAQLDALAAPTLPAAVTAGDSFDIRLDFSASPRAGAVMQTLKVTQASLTITFDGETTVLQLGDSFFEGVGSSGLYFETLLLDSSGGHAMPVTLTGIANTDAILLTVRTDPTRTGVLTADFTATAIDVATGTQTAQTSGTANTTIS
ncbi:MAG: hypothetical protein H6841_02625 [Planctomycetes bacterium]|nr:hypothetical protein [Planctomycetota bacterium]MCB9936355.1 hypothetical protein [Planctomycetota bacterium]